MRSPTILQPHILRDPPVECTRRSRMIGPPVSTLSADKAEDKHRGIVSWCHVPIRSAERSIVGEAGRGAAGRQGLQRSGHVVAIEGCNARTPGAIGVRRARSGLPRDIVAGWRGARAARRRWDHGHGTGRNVVAVAHVTAVVHRAPGARRVSS